MKCRRLFAWKLVTALFAMGGANDAALGRARAARRHLRIEFFFAFDNIRVLLIVVSVGVKFLLVGLGVVKLGDLLGVGRHLGLFVVAAT